MSMGNEEKVLLEAIAAFNRKVLVVSPQYEILAIRGRGAGVREADVVGKKCYEVLYNLAAPCEKCPTPEVGQQRRLTLSPGHHRSLDPDTMPCLYSYPIVAGDDIKAFVMMDFDFPAMDGLEDRLRRSNAFLSNLLLSAADCIIAADKTGKILIFNDAAAEVFGYTVEEALNSLDIRDLYPGDGAKEVMRELRSDEYGGKGKLKTYHVDVLAKNGERIPISLYASIIYEDGREVATIGFFHDLRDRLRINAELEKTRLQLLQAEKMASLGKLAAGVAHQINNPLGGITLFAKLMLEEYELENAVQKDLHRILRDAQRCKDTVKELLEFARQTRKLMRPHDVNNTIARTLFLLENQSLFQNIEIEKKFSSQLPLVMADVQQLNHLFMNIILNAAQAMEGKGRLILETGPAAGGKQVVIKISDTGPGIPEDILPHIFDPFFTTKEEGKGTGLGLSLAYGIVDDHGGNIRAESRVGEGTTFIIELPIASRANQGDESAE